MALGVIQHARIFRNFKNKQQLICYQVVKSNSSVPPNVDTIILARNSNEEIIVPQEVASFTQDMIGPPHLVSNLRPIIWFRSPTETQLQRKLRILQNNTQDWNQHFWETHNSNFIKERKMYVQKHLPADKQTLTADEMSEFYKEFLDKNWKSHVNYNFQWYKSNFAILFLSIIVNVERLFQRT